MQTSLLDLLEDAPEATPAPEWVRGVCPDCGAELVSECFYIQGRGYLVIWRCWRECGYRRVL